MIIIFQIYYKYIILFKHLEKNKNNNIFFK